MNFFKRAFLCVMAVIVLALLVSCNDNDTEEQTDTAETQESITTSVDNSDGDFFDPVEEDDGDEESKPSGGTASDTEIRLGDDNKNWGSYNPY